MTLQEKAICQVYTGYCFCQGDELLAVYDYVSLLMGRRVYTHEFSSLADELRDLARDDFKAVCAGKYGDDGFQIIPPSLAFKMMDDQIRKDTQNAKSKRT